MRYATISILCLSLIIALTSWCDKEATKPSLENGYIIVHLTDAPADFDAVNITFSEISAHIDSDWVTIDLQQDSTVNLLEWTNGKSMILGQEDIFVVMYVSNRGGASVNNLEANLTFWRDDQNVSDEYEVLITENNPQPVATISTKFKRYFLHRDRVAIFSVDC